MNKHVLIGVLATLFAATVVILAYASHDGNGFKLFYFNDGNETDAGWSWRPLFYVIAMLFGILCGYLHVHLARRTRVNLLLEFKRAIRAGAFTRSLLVSPIVFGAIYAITKNQPDLIIGTVVAFENGFFCDVILRGREEFASDSKSSETK